MCPFKKAIKMIQNLADKIMFNIIAITFFIAITTNSFCVVIDKIAVIVNDEVITQREINQHLSPIYEQYNKEYTGKKLQNKMLEAEDMIINQLIEDKLILSEAKRQGIAATDKEIEIKLQTVKNKFETEENFRNTLAEQNISLSELRDRIKSDIIKSKLIRKEMGAKVTITPKEVQEYYNSYIEDFTEPEKVRVIGILVRKNRGGRTEEENKFLIEKIKELIKNGEDFKRLAKEYSEETNGGGGENIELIEKGQMIKEIDEAIFSLEEGEISNVIESPIGYHLFKVIEKIPAKVKDFEVAKSEIEDLLYKEKINEKLKKWLTELKKNAYISIK